MYTPVDVVYTLIGDMSVPSDFIACVSLNSCPGRRHSTFVGSMERPCRSCSVPVEQWQQSPGTGQCGLTKLSAVFCDHLMVFAGASAPVIVPQTNVLSNSL